MVKLNPIFKRIQTTKKRYILITGGRGSAKSFSVNTLLVLLTHIVGHVILFCRYTMTSAKTSIIPEFRTKIELLGEEHLFEVVANEVTNIRSGSNILFRGIKTSSGNQTANLKSTQGLTTFVVEEGEEFTDEDAFDKIDESVRTKGKRNRVIIMMNPTTKDHWIYGRWFKNHLKYIEIDGFQVPVSNHPDVEHIHVTYLDNTKHLSKSFLKLIKDLKKSNPDKYFHRFLGAWLEKAEGVIFENWEIGKFNNYLPYCYAMDYGFFPDPLALVKIAVDSRKKEIYIHQLAYELKLNNEGVLDLLKNIRKGELIVADTNEPRTTDMIAEKGYNIVKAEKGAGSVMDDIRDIQDYKIIVTEESQDIITEFNNYSWNNKKASIPIGEYDHAMSAMRYGFRALVDKTRGGISWAGNKSHTI